MGARGMLALLASVAVAMPSGMTQASADPVPAAPGLGPVGS